MQHYVRLQHDNPVPNTWPASTFGTPTSTFDSGSQPSHGYKNMLHYYVVLLSGLRQTITAYWTLDIQYPRACSKWRSRHFSFESRSGRNRRRTMIKRPLSRSSRSRSGVPVLGMESVVLCFLPGHFQKITGDPKYIPSNTLSGGGIRGKSFAGIFHDHPPSIVHPCDRTPSFSIKFRRKSILNM